MWLAAVVGVVTLSGVVFQGLAAAGPVAYNGAVRAKGSPV